MVLFVRAAAFEDYVAWDAGLGHEAELTLVEYVLLWLEFDVDRLGEVLSLLVVARHRRYKQALWHLSQWQRLSFQGAL